MIIQNFQALYKFEGYVVEDVSCHEVGAQINLRFDKRCRPKCPRCDNSIPKNFTATGMVMDLPIADGIVVAIKFPTVQGHCKHCKVYVTTRPKEMHPTKKATWRLMRHISSWARHCPATHIATMFEISDNTVRTYDKEVLRHELPPTDLDNLRAILIDEKSVRKGHNYLTIVLNADTGELLYMAEGKKKEVIDAFFEQLTPEQRARIEAVGIDRAGAYQRSIEEYLPNAGIVYDRFHLMMNMNQAVDQVRRQEWRNASQKDKKFIKGSRFLTLANPENLDEKGEKRLQSLLEVNKNISVAYQLKEQFKAIFSHASTLCAKVSLEAWGKMALESGLEPFKRLARSLLKQKERVCGFIKYGITSGRIEGFNNQVSRVVHRACGIKDLEYLELKLRQISVM